MKRFLAIGFTFTAVLVLSAHDVTRDLLHEPLRDAWPTYSGDYSGRRYSALTQIHQSNVKALVSLARAEKDVQMKRRIVQKLSGISSPEAADYLAELLKP